MPPYRLLRHLFLVSISLLLALSACGTGSFETQASTSTATSTSTPTSTATVTPTPTSTPTATPTPIGGGGGRIAFVSDRDGNLEIYVMNFDGSGLSRLTNSPTLEFAPIWSPDGTKIMFRSVESSDKQEDLWRAAGDIYVADASGGGLTRLTNDLIHGYSPIWSPDGTKVMFMSGEDDFNWNACYSERNCKTDIYVANVDGSGITNLSNDPAMDDSPVWSPDGTRIAFVSYRDSDGEVFVVNVDGSNLIQLSGDPASHVWISGASWSPDGKWVTFQESRDYRSFDVSVVNADGSGPADLPNVSDFAGVPIWSPDGERIAFASDRDANAEIYVMDSDGGNLVNLTNSPDQGEYNPRWSPDGTRLSFSCSILNKWNVWAVNADGSDLTNLTPSGYTGWSLYQWWSPDGKFIFFQVSSYGESKSYVAIADGSRVSPLDFSFVFSPDGAWVIYTSEGEIYMMDTDCVGLPAEECSSGATDLTDNPADDSNPVWQP